jgi:hypothetical protein
MITLNELGYYKDMDIEHYNNLLKLSEKIDKLREAYGKPLRVTSGYRSKEKHLAIYAAKGITDQKKIPMKSKHLVGLAVDLVPVKEPVSDLHKFIKSNIALMQEIGLWFEDFSKTPTWTHVQIVAPKSGKMFFLP